MPAFDELCSLAREAALLESIEALLGWDERTYMPPAAGEYRAEQMTYLVGPGPSRSGPIRGWASCWASWRRATWPKTRTATPARRSAS